MSLSDSHNPRIAPALKEASVGHGCHPGPQRRGMRCAGPWRLALIAAVTAAGCGTTRVTDTQRTATEQLLVSNAVDQAISQLDFRILAGKPVYFDAQYLAGSIDRGYVVSSLRQHLLASGCILQEDRAQATYVVEARSGGIGTDRHQLLIGVPEMNVPSLLPGQPTLIPEIPLAKRTDQKGVAKLAVFAYNRRTGRPVWQSGVVRMVSTSKDTWLLGAGPFRQGTIGDGTEFAGEPLRIPQIPLPLVSGKAPENTPPPAIEVTRAASWTEAPSDPETWSLPPSGPQSFFRLTEFPTAMEQPEAMAPLFRTGESAEVDNRELDGAVHPPRRGPGTNQSPQPGRDSGNRKGISPSSPGGDRRP